MALATTTYAAALSAVAQGLISTYSVVSDSFITSGLLNANNVMFLTDNLVEGAKVHRMPLLTYQTRTDATTTNRSSFTRNVTKTATAAPYRLRTSHVSDPTHGATDDPNRIASILNTDNIDSEGIAYLSEIGKVHAQTAYRGMMENFMTQLYANVQLKTDYDGLGAGGAATTFANDCPHADYTQTTNFTTATDVKEAAFSFMEEVQAAAALLKPYCLGEAPYLVVPETIFRQLAPRLDYFFGSDRRRMNDSTMGGTGFYFNSQSYPMGDIMLVSRPDKNFPKINTNADSEGLLLTPSAFKTFVSDASLMTGISMLDRTLESNGEPNYAVGGSPEMIEMLSSRTQDLAVGALMPQKISTSTLPRCIRMSFQNMGPGTATYADYIYGRADLAICVVRANPYAMRKFILPDALYSVAVDNT